MREENDMKQKYLSPRIQIIRVRLECGVAVQVSAHVIMYPDWEEVETPVGTNTNTEGGDLFLF